MIFSGANWRIGRGILFVMTEQLDLTIVYEPGEDGWVVASIPERARCADRAASGSALALWRQRRRVGGSLQGPRGCVRGDDEEIGRCSNSPPVLEGEPRASVCLNREDRETWPEQLP